jgi:hypothetical protein
MPCSALYNDNICSSVSQEGTTVSESNAGVTHVFAGSAPVVHATYDRLLEVLRSFGPFREDPKKTSIHLVRTTGFAGVHPRKQALILNLRLDHLLDSPRVMKREQVSKNRFHNEIKLEHPAQVDDELTSWLQSAYELGG